MKALALGRAVAANMPAYGVLASLMAHACVPCRSGPFGKEGHEALRYVMLVPETDRSFFRCSECGERWIRSAGTSCGFSWARYQPETTSRERGGPARI